MELHMFIIWEKGRSFEKKIEQDIRRLFTILQIIDIQWSEEKTTCNFARFYGVNLPTGVNKEEQCGGGEFRVIIVQDPSPEYALRDTSHGKESVNIHTFDSKTRYRQWIGGSSKVHATNNSKEFNHDVTLLLGINEKDYLSNLSQHGQYEKIKQDIVGAHGWVSINQLFYVLNNTVDYVILRGLEGLERHSFPNSHRDCDLLVDNVPNTQLIINGTTLAGPVRPHESVNIEGYTYYLDLWGYDRYYFDIQWCMDMLASKTTEDGFNVLNETNNFYCLLYHCLVTKGRFSDDYLPILDKYRQTHSMESYGYPELLVSFLQHNHYEIVYHNGNGAGFHIEDPIINRYYNKYGKVLGKSCCIQKDIGTGKNLEWKSCVYDAGDTIVKAGTDWLIDNEVRFLRRLQSHNLAPKVLDERKEGQDAVFSMEKIKGQTLNDFFSLKYNHKRKIITSVASQIVSALTLLKDNNIVHRDFTGNNLLVDCEGNVRLIDFGWAIDTTADQFPRPEKLTSRYRPPEMYSDFYTIGAVLSEVTNYRLPYLQRLSARLCEIQWQDYFDDSSYSAKLDAVNHALHADFGLRDHLHCFLFRHKRISRYYNKFRRIIWR